MKADSGVHHNNLPFFSGGGDMGELLRSVNWPATPLGPPAEWPSALKQMVSMMLTTTFPVLICWGKDYIQLYNDAFRPINGVTKHPKAVGGSARDTYAEIWDAIGPMFEGVMNGQSVGFPNFMVQLDRNGQPEDCYFDFSYSPIRDENGTIGGILVICVETTEKVRAIKEMAVTTEEFAATNEELESANEELAATNEELIETQHNLRQLNAALAESESRLKMAIETTHLGTWDYSPVSGALYWSEECRNIYGLGPDQTISFTDFSAQIFPDDRVRVLDEIKSAMDAAGNGRYDITYRVVRFDNNETRWIQAQGAVFFDTNRQPERFIGTVLDITESQLAQEKIARNEKFFRSIAINIPNSVVIVIDKDHRYLLVEGDLMDKMGYKRRDYEGKHPTEIGQTERYMASKHLYDRMMSGEKFTVERRAATGEHFIVHMVPLKNDRGEVEAGLVMAIDVTAIKEAEEKSAKLAAIVESSDDAIISKTLESVITSWNDSAQRMFGYTAGEIIGQTIYKLIPPDRQEEEPKILARLKAGARVEHFETKRLTKDGRLLDVSLTISPVKDSQGNIIGLSKIARDITDVKLAEEKNAKLVAIVESSDDAIVSKTLESVITSWNDSAQRMFGYTADEIIGQTIYKIIPPDRHEEEPQILSRLKKGERVQHFETKRLTKDGRLLDVSLTISPVKDPQGNIIGLSKIARDITEKKLEEQRKNDFIGMVSHELKTPLTSLKGIVQVANAKLNNSEDTFLASAMQKANVQVKRMTAMINGFLNVARLEAGKMPIEKEQFSLDQMLREILDETKLVVSTHTVNLAGSGPVVVNADREKISSVISNLVSNAVKYSPRGKIIELAYQVNGKTAIVSVKDEGFGIKPEDLDKVFTRYYRVENSDTRHIAGFGIGLYLSAEIIEGHNGKIWAESEIGKGSVFYFELPLGRG